MAVEHPRHHEEPVELLSHIGAHRLDDVVAVIDRGHGVERTVRPAVRHEQLAAPSFELAQVGVGRVQRSELLHRGQVGVEVEVGDLVVRVIEDEVPQELERGEVTKGRTSLRECQLTHPGRVRVPHCR